tara:strand:- start:2905 stop:4380 length:1476 start_codon:yes stop_codon:yes gene_type:complete
MDFTNQWHYLLAMAPEIVLIGFAIGLLLFGVSRDKSQDSMKNRDLGWIALLGVAVSAFGNGWLYASASSSSQGIVTVDTYSLLANWILLLSLAMVILISVPYVERQKLQAPEYFALLMFGTVGLMVMSASLDLMLIFIGLEIASISIYALVAIDQRSSRGAEAGLKYFLLGAFSTGIFLYGVALIYGATSSVNLVAIADTFVDGQSNELMLLVGTIMLAVGFCFKVSVVPFHMWTPDAYEGAPLPVTAYMSVAVKSGAFLTFYRVFSVYLEGAHHSWSEVLWGLSILTMVGANLIALTQNNIKRLLAYSGIAHSGYLLMTLVANNATSQSGLLFYLTAYVLSSLGLFAGIVFVSNQSETNVDVENYSGLGVNYPFIAFALTVFLLSLGGFPGTGGFIGKVLILQGSLESGHISLAVALVLSTLISYGYYLRIVWLMWMKDPLAQDADNPSSPIVVPLILQLLLVFTLVSVIYLGLLPGQWIEFVESIAIGK